MATFHIDFFAQTLRRKVSITAVIPMDAPPEIMPNVPEIFKAVYLLHGFSGSQTDWLYGAPLQELAVQHGMAFIMPPGENSFYLNDEIRGAMYEDFVCKELPAFCRRIFPLSPEAKDTIIGGLSMGGFGAIHSGLAHPEVFGSIIALSPALITDEISKMKEGQGNVIAPYSYYQHTFGLPAKLLGGHNDPKALVKVLTEKKGAIPRIYMACGTEDFLINEFRDFHQFLENLNIKHECAEGPGIHDWRFWNEYLPKGLSWLTEKAV
jgi:S-formylglutathione hydrolase FrmB